MGETLDLGRRIELCPMDPYGQDISLGLYRQDGEAGAEFLVHTYSRGDGAAERVGFLRLALEALVGLEPVADRPDWQRFACGDRHERALKRSFLDICRLESGSELEPYPLARQDKKAGCVLAVVGDGGGRYRVEPEAGAEQGPRRAVAVARGYVKLCEMVSDDEASAEMRFGCGTAHDRLLGLLLFRAQNVRSAMKEAEAAAARGMLTSPGQQD